MNENIKETKELNEQETEKVNGGLQVFFPPQREEKSTQKQLVIEESTATLMPCSMET